MGGEPKGTGVGADHEPDSGNNSTSLSAVDSPTEPITSRTVVIGSDFVVVRPRRMTLGIAVEPDAPVVVAAPVDASF